MWLQKSLANVKNIGLVKVITGIRRCGKSYLLNTLFYHHLLDSGVPENHIIRFANVLYNELPMWGYNVDVGIVTTAQKDSIGKVIRKQEQEIRPFRKIDDSIRSLYTYEEANDS